MVAGTKYEYNKVQGSDEQTDGGTAASAVDDDDHEPVTVEIPPKQAGAPLGIGLTSDSGSCLDRFLSYFVDVPPPQLVVVQISPESPAAGLLQPGDVIYSINGIGGESSMTADAASTFIRSATTLRIQVLPQEVASVVLKERTAAAAPRRLLALMLLGILLFTVCGGLLYGTLVPWLRLCAAQKEVMQLHKRLISQREALELELGQLREQCRQASRQGFSGRTGLGAGGDEDSLSQLRASPASTAFVHHNKSQKHSSHGRLKNQTTKSSSYRVQQEGGKGISKVELSSGSAKSRGRRRRASL